MFIPVACLYMYGMFLDILVDTGGYGPLFLTVAKEKCHLPH